MCKSHNLMKSKHPTVAVILDNRRAKVDAAGNEMYPLKLRITYAGQRLYYPLQQNCSLDVWDEVLKPKGGGERIRKLRSLKSEKEAAANKIINRLQVEEKPFSLAVFDRLFNSQSAVGEERPDLSDILVSIRAYADALKAEGRIPSGESYESLLSSLERFHKRKNLSVSEITPDFLRNYHKFMETEGRKDRRVQCKVEKEQPKNKREQHKEEVEGQQIKRGQSLAGIGIYMRNLRCIVNKSLSAGFIDKDSYPFGKGKYEIPTGGNVKKALNIDHIRAMMNHPLPSNSLVERGRDLWMFSYLCNGMNIKDICLLRWSDIDGDVFHFVRAKTKRTTKETKHIRVILNDVTRGVIERWGNPDRQANVHVFPFLQPGMTARQIRDVTQLITKSVNKYIKQIADELGITAPITTYWARHSFASQLLRSNAPAKLIGDSLGHSNLKTTQGYLADFDEAAQRQYVERLI